jgi:hypothetical protein
MMREALAKLDRNANPAANLRIEKANGTILCTFLGTLVRYEQRRGRIVN